MGQGLKDLGKLLSNSSKVVNGSKGHEASGDTPGVWIDHVLEEALQVSSYATVT